MSVDVFYEGFALGKALPARWEGERCFVELVPPMPVGTWLRLIEGGKEQSTRVVAISEGVIAGVWVRAEDPEPNAPDEVEGDVTAKERQQRKDRRSRPRRGVHEK